MTPGVRSRAAVYPDGEEGRVVACARDVQRDAKELRLDDAILRERAGQLLFPEVRQARPEPDVRRLRPLRLNGADPFHRLLHSEVAPLEQQLA